MDPDPFLMELTFWGRLDLSQPNIVLVPPSQ